MQKRIYWLAAAVAITLLLALVLTGKSEQRDESMSNYRFIVPDATTNLVTNPSIEIDTTGYTKVGTSTVLAQVITQQQRGVYSLEVTPDSGTNDGVYFDITLTASTQYTWSVDFLGADTIVYTLRVYDITGTTDLATLDVTGDGAWSRQEVVFTTGLNTGIRLFIEKKNSADVSPFYVDGMQVEQKGYRTTYCDGDQKGCSWLGGAHVSTSSRPGQNAVGGRIVDPDDYNILIKYVDGLGMPPTRLNTTQLALLPGNQVQSSRYGERVLQIVGTAGPGTPAQLRQYLQDFENALKPERAPIQQPIIFQYTGTSKTIDIECWYDAGLEGTTRDNAFMSFAMRLVCPNPFFRSLTETAASLDTNDSLSIGGVALRHPGEWSNLGVTSGTGDAVYTVAVGPDGKVYVGGNFTSFNGVTGADGIAMYDPTDDSWNALGSGCTNMVSGGVVAIAFGIDGTVYIGGFFDEVDSVANTVNIAAWDGSSWSALGTGGSGGDGVFALAVGRDGTLYAGGNFTSMGGVANTTQIASWDGSSWSALSTGMSNDVNDLAIGPDGTLYAAGDFTTPGNRIASWDGSAWTDLDPNDVLTTSANSIAVRDDGRVFVGAQDSDLKKTLEMISPGVFTPVAGGTESNPAYNLSIGPSGELIASGAFTTAGDLTVDRFAIFNMFDWVRPDIDFPGSPSIVAVHNGNTKIYVSTTVTGTAQVSGFTTITNDGTATALPRITISRSGGTSALLQSIYNETTGQELYFDLAIADGDTIVIDFVDRTVTSKFSGASAIKDLLRGSDFSEWALAPGENVISVFVNETGSPTITAVMSWKERYLSVNGAE